MTPFGKGDWRATFIFPVLAQLAIMVGSLSTVVSSIREVSMKPVPTLFGCFLNPNPHMQVYVWG
jgi:hypothetical protein